ncbi:DUF6868 family protein [Arenicella xantha]|uniref:DUF6868 domain-containing protein n=1 Tax=Arenicella xantha TaxID=644221 RepID=A0A395JIS6_9GAMM|nr:hypothetical protein [Arenicella xantha]RBP48531.1 hypothetical protein DFR28_10616 [Arenicella xantha]
MMTLSQLTELIGWASLVNIAYLMLATIVIVFMRGAIISIHNKVFGVGTKELDAKYFDFLSHYKVMTLVFFVAPYIALKIMGQ